MCSCPICRPRKPTADDIRRQQAEILRYEQGLARDEARRNEVLKKPAANAPIYGCVFAKSCNLPDGVINHNNPAGFVPVEKLTDYGLWAVLGTGSAITPQGTLLQRVGGSATGRAIAERLGGSLALTLLESSSVVATGAALGTVALLIPNTSISPDSAFYTNDQYAMLDAGRTRVRVNTKTLPDGSVTIYGFYTGGKSDWETVPVIKAKKEGETYVADIGNGIGLTWTQRQTLTMCRVFLPWKAPHRYPLRGCIHQPNEPTRYWSTRSIRPTTKMQSSRSPPPAFSRSIFH